MKIADYRELLAKAEKKSKYKNKRTAKCDSRKEADRHYALLQLERDGYIRDLRTQVTYKFLKSPFSNRFLSYRADFVYHITEKGEKYGLGKVSNNPVVEDVKPSGKRFKRTEAWRTFVYKAALMKHFYNIEVRII